MNSITLTGRLTRDPEHRITPNGKEVTNFSLAVDRERKREGQPQADFFRVTVWGKQAVNVAKYCEKGQKVAVIGPLHLNPYTKKDLTETISAEVTGEHVEFLDRKKENQPVQEDKTINPEDFKDDGLPF